MLRLALSALHDPRFYPALLNRKELGTGFLYLVKLLVACWFVAALWLMGLMHYWQANPDISPYEMPTQSLRKIVPQFPTVIIENGKLRIDGPEQTLNLKDPDSGETIMRIDATGNAPAADAATLPFLLTRSAVFVRIGEQEMQYDIPADFNATIDTTLLDTTVRRMEQLMPYAPLIMLPFNVALSLLSFVGRWLLMGGIAYIALQPRLPNIAVPDVLRLSAFALTASVLLKVLLVGFGLNPFSSPETLVLAVGLLYLFFALAACLQVRK